MFSRKTIAFLKELEANNDRDWFADNKQRYEDTVRTPALEYIEQMVDGMYRLSPHFDVQAKKVGGSLMRVHRDTRFSKDNTPYKTNIGIQFRHVRGKDVHAPGFYLHIEPGQVFLGGGIWRPESSTLKAVRTLIDEHPKEWRKIVRGIENSKRGTFRLAGESLKRPPKGFDAQHPMIDDLKRKDYMAIHDMPPSKIHSSTIVEDTLALFTVAAPLVRFICEADDLPF